MTTRRKFLKMSAAGLCGLTAMSALSPLHAATNDGQPATPRFIFLRKSNGLFPEFLIPPSLKDKVGGKGLLEFDLDKHELPDWLQPLNKHKKNLTLLQGLSAKMCEMGHSTYQSPLGVFKGSERISTIKRATVDIELGRLFPSPLEHVELTCAKNETGVVRGMSSIGPQQPNYAYASPRAAYENLFVLASNDQKSRINNQLDNSLNELIDKTVSEKNQSHQSLREKAKLGGYADAVEALIKRNQKLVAMSDQIKKYAPKLSKEIMADTYTTVEQHRAFVDILLSTMYAKLSNVITFTLDDLSTVVSGIIEGHGIQLHDVGHNKDQKGVPALEVRLKLRTHHMTLVDAIVTGLKSMPEGNGSMFDNTMIMYMPENGEKHHSIGTAVPFVIMAGDKVKLDLGRRYIQLPGYEESDHKTLGNFFTTILNAYGNPIKHYGDFDVALKIDQSGPIKKLMKG